MAEKTLVIVTKCCPYLSTESRKTNAMDANSLMKRIPVDRILCTLGKCLADCT